MQKNTLQTQLIEYLARYENDSHTQKTLDFLARQDGFEQDDFREGDFRQDDFRQDGFEQDDFRQDDFWQKENPTGHITASAWIVNQAKNKALLTHHLKLDKWFQLGGHIESGDIDIFDACLREATEESGLKSLYLPQKTLFDVDVHLIPVSKTGFSAHFHYDIRVLLVADEEECINFDEKESKSVKWFDFQEI
ncbi:MAG: hypothetical protein RI894_701, partial [Bacteroidota bacterium]